MFDLTGQKALVIGVANDQSIAWGCAKALHRNGAEVAITYLNEKAEPHVRPLAEQIGAPIVMPLDVGSEDELDALFSEISRTWGRLDTVVHSIAYCPKEDLQGRVIDCSAKGFAIAMDISVHSFLRILKRAEPLMPHGGTCMTVSFHGAQKVVGNYNIMGPVKAALETATRYAAAELGPKMISVHALSPGPLKTRAASGIAEFDEMLNEAADRAPTHQLATIEEVGAFAAFLASPEAANVTGGIHYIDGGYSIVG
ncbi:enoyl-ACP reductase FabI [Stappia sp. GBMRC 2046]|uniref:Enoyl-[acyl-carrier-protein] reductase [NADH] n=1 Tax=Stappia sediminis TaxID=2692190 RepID=A0A7X3LUZ2_9HYPH|nr:enoyl-ACP reductase FabI [Stappia sediminis]MXN65558.1 enoyl-ACP reductase FabI [Stappia sediminis]